VNERTIIFREEARETGARHRREELHDPGRYVHRIDEADSGNDTRRAGRETVTRGGGGDQVTRMTGFARKPRSARKVSGMHVKSI